MIRFKLQKSQLTGNVFPVQVDSRPYDLDDLKEAICKRYGSIGAAVVDETLQCIVRELMDGRSVSLKNFGSFSLRLGMSKDNVKDIKSVRSQDVGVKAVRFRMSSKLKSDVMQQHVHQVKESSAALADVEEHWQMLREFLMRECEERQISMADLTVTVGCYRSITGCTDYKARKELQQFEEEGKLVRIDTRQVMLYKPGGRVN